MTVSVFKSDERVSAASKTLPKEPRARGEPIKQEMREAV